MNQNSDQCRLIKQIENLSLMRQPHFIFTKKENKISINKIDLNKLLLELFQDD
ncbi:unnamed protein product (macronuclear) [Paramecium tetraurelia]|uniref:Thioredoxin-like fold domain-containing protein n=1 Tax=Paramecium tetraurelia TaxID=5888 RepID=A0BI11_PARTE|nr:uncharacterized protein GSPATT00029214001 [Paramecium tetraurelia]CAK58178.1 unnamed protein product [Paramecium tetraurelia]|eukprot:XP_001425576.1 hypothetical protein (macronuclear) [Paramecium tetraurelia strain d4-2]